MRFRPARLVAVWLVVALGALIAPGAVLAASASDDRLAIALLEAPVSGRDDPRAQIYIVDQLPPGTTVTTAVPLDATGGERYAVVWAELASPPIVGGAREINRVGVRIYLSVAGEQQVTDFAITSIAAARDQEGRPQISAQVRNTGDRAIDVAGTIDLSQGPAGLQSQPSPTDATVTIAPGDTQSVSATFDPELPAGPWLATVSLASGTVQHQESATVTVPAEGAAPVVVPIRSTWWLWLIGSGLAVLAIVVVMWLILGNRVARRRLALQA